MKTSLHKVSIVFVTHNGLNDFIECLGSLAGQTYKDFEIVVVDNGSDQKMIEYLDSITNQITLIKTGVNNGFGCGNNIGAKHCSGDLILFTNYDAVFENDWLENLVKTATSSDEIAIVAPKILFYSNREFVNTCGVFFSYLGYACSDGLNKPSDYYIEKKNIACASGCCFLMKRDIFEIVGGFDEEFHRFGKKFFFSSLEDIDLCIKTHLVGKTVVLDPNSIMYHKYYQKSLSTLRYLYLECGRYYTILKNYSLMTILLLVPALTVFECMALAFALLKGPMFFIKKIESYLIIISKLPIIIKNKNVFRKYLKLKMSDLLKILGTGIYLKHMSLPFHCGEKIEFLLNHFFAFYKSIVINAILVIEKRRNNQ